MNTRTPTYDASAARICSEMADRYGYQTAADVPARLKVELLERHVDRRHSVLDVGCGNGLHLRHAAALGGRVVGADISERMLEVAGEMLEAQNLHHIELVPASASDLPFDDSSFDLVYSFSTLTMVADLHQALNEIVRVLRPGGTAILDVVGRWNLSWRHWNRYYQAHGHFGMHGMTWPQLAYALERRHMEIVEAHATGVADQCRYRGRLEPLGRLVHGPGRRDLDYRVSNLPGLRRLAARWYVVATKLGA